MAMSRKRQKMNSGPYPDSRCIPATVFPARCAKSVFEFVTRYSTLIIRLRLRCFRKGRCPNRCPIPCRTSPNHAELSRLVPAWPIENTQSDFFWHVFKTAAFNHSATPPPLILPYLWTIVDLPLPNRCLFWLGSHEVAERKRTLTPQSSPT